MKIKLRAEFIQKKLLPQHTLTLIKIVSMNISMTQLLDQALILTFLK
jgi:hypothetical protein